jgi:hypothetical protein
MQAEVFINNLRNMATTATRPVNRLSVVNRFVWEVGGSLETLFLAAGLHVHTTSYSTKEDHDYEAILRTASTKSRGLYNLVYYLQPWCVL